MKKPADVDVLQSIKDMFFSKNDYRLVTDYVLQDGKTHPFAILVPGGGYYMVCSFIEGVPIAKKLNAKGISVFILYYHVKQKAAFPAPVDDLARAVREILADADKYHVDPKNYSIWGASAGAHLTAVFGTAHIGYPKYDLPRPGALVLSYPVISMDRAITHQQSHDFFIGKDASEVDEALVSAEKHVHADYPATFLWCSDDDSVVNPENTKRMNDALATAGIPHLCTTVHGVPHGAGPGTGTSVEGWIDQAITFWKENGR